MVYKSYYSHGWTLPDKIENWIHQHWIDKVDAKDGSPIDYMTITNSILYGEPKETVAIVAFVNRTENKVLLVYGKEKSTYQELRFTVSPGTVLKIKYVPMGRKNIQVVKATPTELPPNLDYAKYVTGKIQGVRNRLFAFLNTDQGKFFIPPDIVAKNNLQHNDKAKAIIIYTFNKKKQEWDWICVNAEKQIFTKMSV